MEFLLINHPLDCPVCDKGGECPLQDITFGWGSGISRFVDPKRHFVKPLELSPTIAIDRERCILCYRCVRFSQEISEDYQSAPLERGAHSFVSTFDGHPYVAPFSGNIIELCPVGALTSRPLPLPRAPVGHRGGGVGGARCPAECNVTHHRPRRARAARAARDHAEVDDGWLCADGRFAFVLPADERVTGPPRARRRAARRRARVRALAEAGAGFGCGGEHQRDAGGGTHNEEGLLLARLLREGLGSPHLDSRRAGTLPLELHRALGDPRRRPRSQTSSSPHAVLVLDAEPVNDAPILDCACARACAVTG